VGLAICLEAREAAVMIFKREIKQPDGPA